MVVMKFKKLGTLYLLWFVGTLVHINAIGISDSPFKLSRDVDGANGFALRGVGLDDRTGVAATNIGDFNAGIYPCVKYLIVCIHEAIQMGTSSLYLQTC